MRQSSLIIDFGGFLVVEKRKIEAEGRYAHRFLIDVHARNLFTEDFPKLRAAKPPPILLPPSVTHHAAERLHKEDAGSACGIEDAGFLW